MAAPGEHEHSLIEGEMQHSISGKIVEKPAKNKSRSCTDVFCLLVFLGYLGGMYYMYQYALLNGNIAKLTHGFSWEGKICSVDAGVEDKPLLYWCASEKPGVSGGKPEFEISDGICVQKCPTGPNTTSMCPGDPTISRLESKDAQGNVEIQDIVKRLVTKTKDQATEEVLGMYCLPTQSKELVEQILHNSGTGNWAQQAFVGAHGVMAHKNLLGAVALLSVVAGYIFLFMLKKLVKPLVYSFLTIVWLGLLGVSSGCFLMAYAPPGEVTNLFRTYMSEGAANKCAVGAGAVFAVLWLVFSCIACKARKGMAVTCQTIKESCQILSEMPTLMLQPLVTVAVKLAVFAVLLIGFGWVMSLAKVVTTNPLQTESGLSISGMRRKLAFEDWQKCWIAFFAFGIVWILETITALSQYAVCHAVVLHTVNKQKQCLPLCRGFFNGLVFHLGTLAFGGFILGALKVITAICSYIGKTAKNADGSSNKIVSVLCCCCVCCLSCLTHVVDLLNELVYVDVSINGCSYTKAAANVVKLCLSNPVTFAMVHGATRFVRVLGIAVIGGGGTYLTYLYLAHPMSKADAAVKAAPVLDASSIIGTTIAAGFVCFVVAHAFMVVFDNTADAQMYCVLWKKEKMGMKEEDHPESFKLAGAHEENSGDYKPAP